LPVDDPKQRKPDITKAKALLDWEPKVERKEGLAKTYEYFKSLPSEEWSRQPKEFISNK
jgi:dTDP-glucose 4,6-dehydratase